MAKGDLFCIKTDYGYGIFQEYESYPHNYGPFYIVYYNQIKQLCENEILTAMQGDFYYVRIGFGVWDGRFSKKKIMKNMFKENSAEDFGIDDSDPYYGACYITYCGKYDCADDAEIPKFSRELDLSFLTGKYKWYVQDEVNANLLTNEKGKIVSYRKAIEVISDYPDSLCISPKELLKRFNTNYRQENGDAWVERMLEEYYEDNPHMRPTDIKFEEVKSPYPTESWRNNDGDKAYHEFIKEVESALDTFIESLESNKRSVQKPLSKLIVELNRIDKQTGFIGSMEAEDLYGYIVKILRSLKKPRLIELMEDKRTW